VSEDGDLPAGREGELSEAQVLALWSAMPAPLLRLLDLYLLDNPEVPAPHVGMDVERFQAGFVGWYRRSADPEVAAALQEAVEYFATRVQLQRLPRRPPPLQQSEAVGPGG
jgi:hypothetical protein